MLDAALEAEMRREHFKKYEALARKIGIDALLTLMPVDRETMVVRLAADVHLNNVPLTMWDRAAGECSSGPSTCPTCKQRVRPYSSEPRLSFEWPWVPSVANGLSLAERVCAEACCHVLLCCCRT